MTKKTEKESRRGFLKTTTAAAAGVAAVSSIARTANAQGSDEIRFAVIGCGGRGTGAAANIMNTKGNVKLVAVADAFGTKAKNAIRQLSKKYPDKVDVPEDRIFTGIDGFKGAIDVDCDLVVIATPPAFKPMQFEYAADKGRHIFCEKPVASDAVGVRRFMDAVEVTKKKNLLVGIGLQRRHEPQYMETVNRSIRVLLATLSLSASTGTVVEFGTVVVTHSTIYCQLEWSQPKWPTSATTGTTSTGCAAIKSANNTFTIWMSDAG